MSAPVEHVTSASGRCLFYTAPSPGAIHVRDIAHQLATINRWAGAAETPISTAQHSVLVAEQLEDGQDYYLALWGLLHEAHDYMLGDQPRALKDYVARQADRDIIGELAAAIDEQIHAALGVDWPPSQAARAMIRRANEIVGATEFRDLLPDAICPWQHVRPLSRAIRPWPWPKAEERWLQKYEDLCALSGAPNQLEAA